MKKRQLTISTTSELKDFVNRTDVDIESAFRVCEAFLNVGDKNDDKNLSICIKLFLIGGNKKPKFTKENITKWIDDYDRDSRKCIAIFSFG